MKVTDKQLVIPISFKVFGLVIRSGSLIFMFIPFIFIEDFPYEFWQPVVVILMFIGVFYTSIKMLSMKRFIRDDLRKIISIQAFLRYSIVPVMLLGVIGYPLGIFLIFFPVLWYGIFNRLIYGG